MGSLHGDIEVSLSELRRLTSADFVSMAWAETNEYIIRWKYASGNRNDRYKRIVLRLGKGIAGKVISSGRPMILDSFSLKSGDDPREYPILLAESLKSTLAVPVIINDRVKGVLLIGCRYARRFGDEDIELVLSLAEQLGSMIQQRKEQKNEILGSFDQFGEWANNE